jgi:hypothetical protein
MLLHAWVLLTYVAMGSALLLTATVAIMCLRAEPIEFRGFIVSSYRRRPRGYPVRRSSCELQNAA